MKLSISFHVSHSSIRSEPCYLVTEIAIPEAAEASLIPKPQPDPEAADASLIPLLYLPRDSE